MIGSSSPDLYEYLISIVESEPGESAILEGAVNALSVFYKIEEFEKILKKNDDVLSLYVFHALYSLNIVLEDILFEEEKEYSPADRLKESEVKKEEEIRLKVKVLLGKVSSKYESYSNRTKNAYINAMLSCNHRESVIYCMKALESKEPDLISMTLYSLYNNITRLRLPEKLLRSILAMNVENDRDNELVAEIFIRYFSEKGVSRSHTLFRDKQYGYIVATLESFFETYRREFMIPDVVENAFPENIQKIRRFILRYMNPEQKRRLLMFLESKEKQQVEKLVDELSRRIVYIDDEDAEAMSMMIDLLLDEDTVSREISASRIETVNFERRYLQSRIIRLCRIISALKIESAAASLVYIYNYLKKYPEPEIYESAVNSLCRLNYSYMLSELEIMLTAGSPEDQIKAVGLLPLFKEKRLLNIIIDFLNSNFSVSNDVVSGITALLSDQDIKFNINAANVFKKIIESNSDIHIKNYAIIGLGQCAFSDDIVYLNDLFYKIEDQILKEAVVRGLGSIISYQSDYNKQVLIRIVQAYLKDSGIKVRIFSCIILLELGNMDALKNIRDMLIIKNKSIQREILSILRGVKSPDFYFFLVSLLKEEYGISKDIISVLEKLPEEELKEIEIFIINLFRKFEIPVIESGLRDKNRDDGILPDLEKKIVTALFIRVDNYNSLTEKINSLNMIGVNLRLDAVFSPPVDKCGGIISHKDSSKLTAWFDNPVDAIRAACMIKESLDGYNRATVFEGTIEVRMSVLTDSYKIKKGEIFGYLEEEGNSGKGIPLTNRIIIDNRTEESTGESYYARSIPEVLYSGRLSKRIHFELISPVNFKQLALDKLKSREEAIEQKREMEAKIEAQVKALKSGNRSTTSIAIASELEDIGIKIKLQFEEIERFINRRSTDKELSRNVRLMLNNAYNLYRVEISKLTIK